MSCKIEAFEDDLDPNEYKDWQLDFSDDSFLEDSETIFLDSVTFTISDPEFGLTIDGPADVNPVALDVTGKKIEFWARIDAGSQGFPEFEKSGIVLEGQVSFTTIPQGREYERKFGILVRQH